MWPSAITVPFYFGALPCSLSNQPYNYTNTIIALPQFPPLTDWLDGCSPGFFHSFIHNAHNRRGASSLSALIWYWFQIELKLGKRGTKNNKIQSRSASRFNARALYVIVRYTSKGKTRTNACQSNRPGEISLSVSQTNPQVTNVSHWLPPVLWLLVCRREWG